MYRAQFKDNKGITLIEVAILLIVLGLIAVPMIKIYDLYREGEIAKRTEGNPLVIQSALQKYALRTGRYPRPATRNLPVTAVNFGAETAAAGIPNCTVGANVVCRTTGFRDVLPPGGNDPVLIGDVPYAELGLPLYYYTDGYGSKFTYAVTEGLTVPATFTDAGGVIRLWDRTNNNHTGTTSNIHYVVISHGRNQKGAFADGGTLIQACTGAGDDIENCNNNGLFNDNYDFIGVSPNIIYTKYNADAPGADYFDDHVVYSTTTATDIWSRTVGTPDMYSRNAGNVRVGAGTAVGATVNPTARMHVMGDVAATDIETNRLCAASGCPAPGSTAGLTAPNNYAPNVFTPSVIAGPVNPLNESLPGGGISCFETGLIGISNSNENCSGTTIPVPSGTATLLGTCTVGWPRGINASGQFVCGTP